METIEVLDISFTEGLIIHLANWEDFKKMTGEGVAFKKGNLYHSFSEGSMWVYGED